MLSNFSLIVTEEAVIRQHAANLEKIQSMQDVLQSEHIKGEVITTERNIH
jgi:hypothetical protein